MAEQDEWRVLVGGAIQRAMSMRGWSLKEFAAEVQRDPRQVQRWLKGKERPQLDALFAVKSFRQPLLLALAQAAGGDDIEVTTEIRFRDVAR